MFALAELDSELTDRVILLTDTKDGQPVPASEGSYDGPRLFCFTSALDFNPSHFILSHAARLVLGRETPMILSIKISSAKLAAIFMITASASAWAADSSVNVLYAGSLVNLMERNAGPAF